MLWAMNINTVKNADGTVKPLDINECQLDGLAVYVAFRSLGIQVLMATWQLSRTV